MHFHQCNHHGLISKDYELFLKKSYLIHLLAQGSVPND